MKRLVAVVLALGLFAGMTIGSAAGTGAPSAGDAAAAKKKCKKGKKKGKRSDASAAKKCKKKKSGGGGPKTEYRGKTSQGLPIVLEIGHRRADGHFDLRLPCYTNTGSGVTGPEEVVGKATLNGPANTDGTPPYVDFAGSFKVAIAGATGNGKVFGKATKTKVSGQIRNEFASTPTPGPGQVACGTVNITYDIPTS